MSQPAAVAVLVPVKAFGQAKLRLATVLEAPERAALARSMASIVLSAARPLPVWVVCDDNEVAEWATAMDAGVLWSPGKGLNGAVTDGVDALSALGVGRVVVAHADLPLATDLGWVGEWPTDRSGPPGITIVPDERDDGTNVIAVPAGTGFSFHYGPSSFCQHTDEARRLDLDVVVARDPLLGFDVDTPADLSRLAPLQLSVPEHRPA